MATNTFLNGQHKDLKADYIMTNPSFDQKEWCAADELTDDVGWNGYAVPPTSNINYVYTTDISVTFWILNKNKKEHTVDTNEVGKHYRNWEKEIYTGMQHLCNKS